MKNEKDVNIVTVCNELSNHKETMYLVEKVSDGLYKPAEDVSTERLYNEYNNMLTYTAYKKEWLDSHCSELDMANAEALYENTDEAADMTFEEYIEEYGINGMIYSSYAEFCDEEIGYYREPSVLGYSLLIQSKAFNAIRYGKDDGININDVYFNALKESSLYHNKLNFNVCYLDDESGDGIDAIQIDFVDSQFDDISPQYNNIVKAVTDVLNKSEYPLANIDYNIVTIPSTFDFNDTHAFADAIEQYVYERGEYDYSGGDVLSFVDKNKDRHITVQLIDALLQKKDYTSLISYFDSEFCTTSYFNGSLGDLVKAQHYFNAILCLERINRERNQPVREENAEIASYFEIYQMRDRGNRFFGFTYQTPETLKASAFDCVYREPLTSEQEVNDDYLESVYSRFNSGILPREFKGHSLSISDVIFVRKDDGSEKAFFVDQFGFKDISDLFKENHEQDKEHNAKMRYNHSKDALQM